MSNHVPPPSRPLESKRCAIVVGASSGIGAALVRVLAQNGYVVTAVARREELLADLVDSINSTSSDGSTAYYFSHDVTRFDETPGLFQRITRQMGGLDLIVYAAGAQPRMAPDEYDFDKDSAMTHVNFLGAMVWFSQAAQRFERMSGGHIVGISSISADRGRVLNPGYNATKAGLDTYLEGLRNRLSRHGVTVTTIKPGFVDTELLENAPRTMWVISPAAAADQIYKAIKRNKQVAYVPGRWRYIGLIIQHIPSVIFRRLSF